MIILLYKSYLSDIMSAMSISEQFSADVEAFLARSGMKPTVFGKEAVNDPNFVFDLRTGRNPGLSSVDKVYEFIRAKSQLAAETTGE